MSVYLFDMPGEVIAFRRTWADPYLFDVNGHWIGWFPWEDDNDAVDPDGHYLGTVVCDRLVRRNDWYDRPCPPAPQHPETTALTGSPSAPLQFDSCFAYEDLRLPHFA